MITKYGDFNDDIVKKYLEKLIDKIWKLIPMNEKEDERIYIQKYSDSIVRELFGNAKILIALQSDLITISGILKGLDYNNHKSLRSDVFRAINIISRHLKEDD